MGESREQNKASAAGPLVQRLSCRNCGRSLSSWPIQVGSGLAIGVQKVEYFIGLLSPYCSYAPMLIWPPPLMRGFPA